MSELSRKGNQPSQHIDHGLLVKFLEVQESNIKVAARKIELDSKDNDRNAQIAEKAIEAKSKAFEIEQKTNITKSRDQKIYIVFIVVIGLFALCWMLQNGYKDIAVYIIERGVYVVGGGLGGYAVGKHQKEKKQAGSYQELP